MRQGSLQVDGHGGPPIHFEFPPNQKLTKFICFLYIIIRVTWLAPEDILSNQVDNKILALITKPSTILERTLLWSYMVVETDLWARFSNDRPVKFVE